MRQRIYFDKQYAKAIVYRIPVKYFQSETATFADLQAAGGQFIYWVVERLREFSHSDENIKQRVFSFSEKQTYLNILKYRNKSIPATYNLYNIGLDMKFDVVLGNPPYQNGKDKMFYVNFISKAFSVLKNGGVISFINPYSWVHKGVFNQMKKDGYFHYLKQEDGDEIFGISMGSALCTFVYEKNSSITGCSNIEVHPKFSKDAIAQSIIGKIYENSIKPKKGKGQTEFVHQRSETHVFPVYLSSKNTDNDNRTSMWSQSPAPGSGIDKLIVAHILEPGRACRFSEFSKEKGVGRYSQYFECTYLESENIKAFFDSKIYSFVDANMRQGRYAFVQLPNIDWSVEYTDDLIYSKLTQEEIDYIENAVK